MRTDERRRAQLEQVQRSDGFFVALDQSAGSTPRMLRLYGVDVCDYFGEHEMLDRAHELRTRICTSSAFGNPPVLGAILFKDTVDHTFAGKPAAEYLWEVKRVVPFLKIDRGVLPESGGVQLMREIPDLDEVLDEAAAAGVFGVKARSFIKHFSEPGIRAVVKQQLEVAARALARGLVPIIEAEVCVRCREKAACEALLRQALLDALDGLDDDAKVIFRLTIPNARHFYRPLAEHPKTLRVLALGGGYTQPEACRRIARNPEMASCFSRAFLEGLHANQTPAAFDATLRQTCAAVAAACRGEESNGEESESDEEALPTKIHRSQSLPDSPCKGRVGGA